MKELALTLGDDSRSWRAIAPGSNQLSITQVTDAGAPLCLSFEFPDGLGFVVARREGVLEMPETYSLRCRVRGDAPRIGLEFKLVDRSGFNVWRWRTSAFEASSAWREVVVHGRDIEFAWGAQRRDHPRGIAALEIVLVAESTGAGILYLKDLAVCDDTYRRTPVVAASSATRDAPPTDLLAKVHGVAWLSTGAGDQFITIDFQISRELSALEIVWVAAHRPAAFVVQLSDDGTTWRNAYAVTAPPGWRSYCFLPATVTRHLRLKLKVGTAAVVGIESIDVKPWAFARSLDSFFGSIAEAAPRGAFPKYLLGQQSYWTVTGSSASGPQVLINTEGMVEIGPGAYSIEPLVHTDGRLVTWAAVRLEQRLQDGYLPIPSVLWRATTFTLATTVTVISCDAAEPTLILQYQLQNLAPTVQEFTLFAALRPFQVTPPWQRFESYGGLARIESLTWDGSSVLINKLQRAIPLTAPAAFGACAFDQGALLDYLTARTVPSRTAIDDPFGQASGALQFDFSLAPGVTHSVVLTIPLESCGDVQTLISTLTPSPPIQIANAANGWSALLNQCKFELPMSAQALNTTLKTAAAHILINREGPRLQPGPRRYARAYLRDGVIMGAALARFGAIEPLRDFLRWYSSYQAADGKLPDCVDAQGAEWLPEFDAYGEFIFGVMEVFRLSGDLAFLTECAPAATAALNTLERLRAERLTPAYTRPEQRMFYGLLPESMSHEGYMAHPVHAYWDDFWALRGFTDAADMATALGQHAEARRRTALRETFARDLQQSIIACLEHHQLDTLPGAAELGDFDPAASAVALTIADALPYLPTTIVNATFDRYLAGLRERAAGTMAWGNYSAYEVRVVGALVRLGRRRDAHEVLNFMLADRRPLAWNQWPEQSWRDIDAAGFLGDLPHTWISAEFILATLSLFAYERAMDDSLVIAAGIPGEWLSDGFEIIAEGLHTRYGMLTYRVRQPSAECVMLVLEGTLTLPRGGLVLQPPLPRPLLAVEVNGERLDHFDADSCVVHQHPASITLRF